MTASVRGAMAKKVSFERERGVYRIDVTTDVSHLLVAIRDDENRTNDTMKVFRALAADGIAIFLIKLHPTAVSFAIDRDRVAAVEACLKKAGLTWTARNDVAIVSVIASSMRDLTGVMVNIADALTTAGARLYGLGDSHNSVQCLIDGSRVGAALQQLKATFGLEDEGG